MWQNLISAFLFPGDQNPLVILRRYMTTFSCMVDLVLYPFDKQSCGMEFQILNAPKEFLMFNENKTMAENSGSSMLLEYEVSLKKNIFIEHFQGSHRLRNGTTTI